MNPKKHIPNVITLLNLFSGCIAIVYASEENFEMSFFFVFLGIFFDFFDGFFARLFDNSSPLGLQLDSLADMVTSGLVPGFVMFKMLTNSVNSDPSFIYFPYLGFIITLGSCYRLANFNIDTRQIDSFIGLPTPANAIFILSLPLILKNTDSLILLELLTNNWVLLFVTLISAYVLNAEIPLFSLKIKKFNLKDNVLQIVFLLISLLLLIVFKFSGVALIIVFYVMLSVIVNLIKRKNA
ncbi:MAG: phosphatidylserine synthase [Flavobacteriaceae bacterium]|jgi:CDP-diacylglycerol--serine O-phosphatidyltransferase|nr:phosphatidylserine synthase [Flavobacteriaceae bacterium]